MRDRDRRLIEEAMRIEGFWDVANDACIRITSEDMAKELRPGRVFYVSKMETCPTKRYAVEPWELAWAIMDAKKPFGTPLLTVPDRAMDPNSKWIADWVCDALNQKAGLLFLLGK